MKIVQTLGSNWFLDEEHGRYMRVPRHEGPRDEPWLTIGRNTRLEDNLWFEMDRWEITRSGRLFIYAPDGGVVSAPQAKEQGSQ